MLLLLFKLSYFRPFVVLTLGSTILLHFDTIPYQLIISLLFGLLILICASFSYLLAATTGADDQKQAEDIGRNED